MNPNRVQSIDALRGFDMFWIMGGPGIIASLNIIFNGELTWISNQMEHVSWDGFHFMDLIFPLFLFIAGLSFPYSLENGRSKQQSDAKILIGLLKRCLILIALGLIYNGILRFNFSNIRYASVLAHIGVAWFLAAVVYMYSKRTSTLILWTIGIIVIYGLINLILISPQGIGNNHFTPRNNIICQFDRWFLPGELYGGNFDPEGLLGKISAVALALMGMITSRFLGIEKNKQTSTKLRILTLSGIILILWSILIKDLIPINKALWSSTFILLVGGVSILLYTLFYWIIDVHQNYKWSLFFRVIGVNSITIYMAQAIVNFHAINEFFFGGIASKLPNGWNQIVLSIGYVSVCWLVLLILYRNKLFIKV